MSLKIKIFLKSQTLKKVLKFSLAEPFFDLEFGSFDEDYAGNTSIPSWDLLVVEVDHDYCEGDHSKILGIKNDFPELKSLKIVDKLGKLKEWEDFDDQIDRLFGVSDLKCIVNKLVSNTTIEEKKLKKESVPLDENVESSDLNDEWDIDEEFECLEVESDEVSSHCNP